MPLKRSPEVESVAQRTLVAYGFDPDALGNLMSSDPGLRVLGFDRGEWWSGPEEFMSVRETQMREVRVADQLERSDFSVDEVEAFQDGEFGWTTMFSTLVTPEAETQLRHTAVLRLEAGVWRVIQWHNSVPVANEQVYGVDLTKTLSDLVASILDDDKRIPVQQVFHRPTGACHTSRKYPSQPVMGGGLVDASAACGPCLRGLLISTVWGQ